MYQVLNQVLYQVLNLESRARSVHGKNSYQNPNLIGTIEKTNPIVFLPHSHQLNHQLNHKLNHKLNHQPPTMASSVDNSEFMRNGDFMPTRLQAQQEAVGRVCNAKTRSNPENNVGLLTMSSNPEVLTTLTSDVHRIQAKLQQVEPKGMLDFLTAIRIAHLTLKHRQGKNHKMRIVAFVGSPIEVEEKELVKVGKRLKKEKVNVDIVSFGEETVNTDKLTSFINTINGRDGGGSHLVTIPPSDLTQALFNSPVIQGEDGGSGSGMGPNDFDPNDDPDLALALRVSMEEQRARQADSARQGGEGEGGGASSTLQPAGVEDEMLEAALRMSADAPHSSPHAPSPHAPSGIPDFAAMTEDEQIAYALQMSMQQSAQPDNTHAPVSHAPVSHAPESPMETDETPDKQEEKKENK